MIPSPPPLTPPHSEEEKLDWLRLLRSRRVGPATFYRLTAEFGSAAAALAELPQVARAAGVSDYAPCPVDVAAAEMRAARLAGARMLARGMPDYPHALADLADPPPILWAMGDTALLHRPALALVGARNASSLGTRMARRLAAELGEAGFVVVSGLARGIDAAAHLGALASGTVAVMAGGVDVVYPPENAVLAQELLEKGLRLSEQPMGLQPQARHFPRRNRLIAGLARGVVVVEAAARSGSLITARDALDLGREVLAVPGHPFDARSGGSNLLIRDGATLIRGAADVTEVLGAPDAGATPPGPDTRPDDDDGTPSAAARAPAAPVAAPPSATTIESRILGCLGAAPVAEDQLIRDLALPAAEIAPHLVTMELDGRIARNAGGLLHRVE
ncbi:MAG: DNA-processing protein DprA [Tranquillimonas sp.]